MNIHEYQAKSLLQKFGVAVPKGGVAYTPQEAERVARELGGPVWVVKSQIHAGGRGAGRFKDDPGGKGGVRVVKSVEEVAKNAAAMLGHVLVTKQTGAAGREVKRVYIEEGCDITRELYVVPAPIEGLRGNSAKVTHARQDNIHQGDSRRSARFSAGWRACR